MAQLNFTNRRMENIDWRLATYLLAFAVLILYALAMSGCISASPGIPNIFLLKLKTRSEPAREIRVGYFGLCGIVKEQSLNCLSTSGKNTQDIISKFSSDGNATISRSEGVEQLIDLALTFQKKVFLCILAASGVFQFLGIIFLTLVKRQLKLQPNEKNPKSEKRQETLQTFTSVCLGASVAGSLASTLGVAQATGALQCASGIISGGNITVEAGKSLQIMHWFIFSLSFLFAAGVYLMFRRPRIPGFFGGAPSGPPPGYHFGGPPPGIPFGGPSPGMPPPMMFGR